ncbi:unnamed protein product [Schistosoma margrebowiei]|uniref:Radical SAM protein n=1 Tax=Schistosoma margrebowiei TaxID=48269 RepID=A0AA84ZJK4_9TREM|nr:unnamed protein product [Schistosoma margrebowiei]
MKRQKYNFSTHLDITKIYLLLNMNNPHKQFYDPIYEYSDYINQEIIPNKRYIRFGKRGADDVMRYGGIPTLTRHKTYSIYDLLKERQ